MSGLWRGITGLGGVGHLYSGVSGLALGTGLFRYGVAAGDTIYIPGAVGEPGSFDVTISGAGTIATASTDLDNLGAGFTWGIEAAVSDARISVASTASGQPNTMAVLTSGDIPIGDSAAFTITVSNGVISLGFPFIATGTVAIPYRAEALALFARMTTQPDATRKQAYDTLFDEIEAAGMLTNLDFLYIIPAHEEATAQLNIMADQYNLTAYNTPTFVADGYYQGNGTSSYLDTGFNPTTAVSPNFTQNVGLIGVWCTTNSVSTTKFEMGQIASTQIGINCGYNTTNMAAGINGGLGQFANGSTSVGHLACSRTASAGQNGHRNGAYVAYNVNVSSAPGNSNFCLLRRNTAYSDRKLLVAYAGKLGSGNMALFDTALRNFLTTVGAI